MFCSLVAPASRPRARLRHGGSPEPGRGARERRHGLGVREEAKRVRFKRRRVSSSAADAWLGQVFSISQPTLEALRIVWPSLCALYRGECRGACHAGPTQSDAREDSTGPSGECTPVQTTGTVHTTTRFRTRFSDARHRPGAVSMGGGALGGDCRQGPCRVCVSRGGSRGECRGGPASHRPAQSDAREGKCATAG